MFGVLMWLVFGWVAGSIAEWLWPDAAAANRWQTIGIGIAGSVAGGLVGSILSGSHYRPAGILMSVGGALACMYVWRSLEKVNP